jgi:Fic-DOC domain mobile mystery protein B
MLGETWRWAGRYRNKNTNIGLDFHLIREEVPKLCSDVTFWVDNDTYPWPDLAIRFHHRLVKIHPFVNGNGRHARLAADVLLEANGQSALPWGGESLVWATPEREEYLAALREADRNDYQRLAQFAQSGAQV